MKKLIGLITLSLLSISVASAGEKVKILKADVIGENRYVDLYLELDSKKDAKNLHVTEYQNGKVFGRSVYDGQKVNRGVLLLEIKSHKVLKLVSPNFTAYQGGNITLDFLYNGVTGSRGSTDFDLVRSGQDWQLYKNNRKVNLIKIIKNTKLGKDLGIKRIDVN